MLRGTGFTPVSKAPEAVAAERTPGPGFTDTQTRTGVGRFVSAAPDSPPDSAGDLGVISPMRIFADLAVAGETGLVRFERGGPRI